MALVAKLGNEKPLFQVFRDYGMNAGGVTLEAGQGAPDEHMFREAVRQVRMRLG